MKALTFLVVCAVFAPATACAQTAYSVPITAQALTHVHDGRVLGCGVRLTGGEPGPEVSAWFDVSFNVFRRGPGIAQSIAYEIKRSGDGESRPEKVPVRSTWISASEGSTRLGENTERLESLVYTMLIEDVLVLFEAIANRQPLTLGIKRWGQRVDSVYSAAAVLDTDSLFLIDLCLAGLELE